MKVTDFSKTLLRTGVQDVTPQKAGIVILTTAKPCTVERHVSGLIGMESHPDMQKIRMTGFFFFENRLHWQFEVGKNFYQRLF